MKQFNVTAQIYNRNDLYKQTIFMNEIITSTNNKSAEDYFKLGLLERGEVLVKILSIEEISQV